MFRPIYLLLRIYSALVQWF